MWNTSAMPLLGLLLLGLTITPCSGHAYMRLPVSRANTDTTVEPQSVNQKGVCGYHGDLNFNDPQYSTLGKSAPYTAGSTISIEAVVTAHHMGHFEMRLCTDPSRLSSDPGSSTTDRLTSQACFDEHVLARSCSDYAPAPIDHEYPTRWYLPPRSDGDWLSSPQSTPGTRVNHVLADDASSTTFDMPPADELLQAHAHEHAHAKWSGGGGQTYKMEYILPAGVTCDHCVLQWTYVTGNSCSARGYRSYFDAADTCGATTSAWRSGWLGSGDQGSCAPLDAWESHHVGGAPEKFWSCADIQIVDGPAQPTPGSTEKPCYDPCSNAPPPPVTPPAEEPTMPPAEEPADEPTEPPSSVPAGGDGGCHALSNNQNIHDADCAVCASGEITWWPCTPNLYLCDCSGGGPAPAPPVVTPAPAPPTVTPPPPPAGGTCTDTALTGGYEAYSCTDGSLPLPAYCEHEAVAAACCVCGGGTAGPAPPSTPVEEPTTPPVEEPTTPPADEPTEPPTSEPAGGDGGCHAVSNNQNVHDADCAVCASGEIDWWPCTPDLCVCGGGGPAPAPPVVTPAPAPPVVTPAPAPPTPTSGCGTWNCNQQKAACQTFCNSGSGTATNQCWGTPIYMECKCSDDTVHHTECHKCENSLCTSSPAPPPSTPVQEPTEPPTDPSVPPPPPVPPTPPSGDAVQDAINQMNAADWSDILVSQQPDLTWAPSSVYNKNDLIIATRKMLETGIGEYKLAGSTFKYILVNVAAFLAQAMHETIKYDACDENNWDQVSQYSAANSCGQLGQSYQDYHCPAHEAHMACDVDPEMSIVATTHAKWYGAPGPNFCAPKSKVPLAPKWSSGPWCNPATTTFTPWSNADDFFTYLEGTESCKDYEGQKAGSWIACEGAGCPNAPAPAFGKPARTDVEGCCWWGRGVIQTTGVCNFGKLNYYAGKRASDEGRSSLFPDVDFCKTPEAICTSTDHPDLKWIAGLFFWAKEVQAYPSDDQYNFNYEQELRAFTDAGNMNDNSFIDKCSGIVNRGCPASTCSTGHVHEASKRATNFRKVLTALGYPWSTTMLQEQAQDVLAQGLGQLIQRLDDFKENDDIVQEFGPRTL